MSYAPNRIKRVGSTDYTDRLHSYFCRLGILAIAIEKQDK